MSGFTPGPYHRKGAFLYALSPDKLCNRFDAHVQPGFVDGVRTTDAECEATARLFEAAPDLYAVVEELLGAFRKGIRHLETHEEEALYDAAHAAFVKAGGR